MVLLIGSILSGVAFSLSAADFGKLLGVSAQSIYNWERESAYPRVEQIARLAAIRGIGKREANPKGFTDFNDLATKSELGKEAVRRQAGAAVGKVLLDEGQRQKAAKIEKQQRHEQTHEQRPRRAAIDSIA